MEVIIVIAVVVGIALAWTKYLKTEKAKAENAIDSWEPAKEIVSSEKEWPFGEKLSEGKIHVKVSDLAPVAPAEPTGSENRVEAPAPALTVDGHGDVHEVKPAKKAPAKKPVAAKSPAKRAPAKKSST